MTIEEKAKAYDEALKKARMYRDNAKAVEEYSAVARYENIFPELRESEDERIRSELIEYLRGDLDDITTDDTDRWIAYLEKQKEQSLRDFIDDFPYSDQKDQNPDIELIQRSWYMEGYHDRDFFIEPKWILKTGEGGPKYEPNPRYGKSLLGPGPCCCGVNVETEYDEGWRDGHKAGLKDADMQKPAWSEEDENMVKMILGDLEWGRRNTTVNKDIRLYDEKISWLKSLRPCPSWKPSDHQMNILKAVKEYVGRGSGYWGEGLGSLIEDLEKLM